MFIVFFQISELRKQWIRLEPFRTFESLFTIKHRSGQPIFYNYRKALRLTECGGVILVMDCDGVICLTVSHPGKENHHKNKHNKDFIER